MLYLDTSVLTAYYCPERISRKVEKIILHTKQPAISDLTAVELASALSIKIRDKQLSVADGNKIIAQFHAQVEQGLLLWIPVEFQHYQIAKGWIAQFTTPLRTLDALHLAVASQHGLTLLTADVQLAESAGFLGVSAQLISE